MTNSKSSNGRANVDKLGDQGGFFDIFVRPKFQNGHEGELCSWLRESSLIRTNLTCTNPDCQGKSLTWSSARIVDRYNWVCQNCTKKQSIRDGSFFFGLKGDLKICLQTILAWCQDLSVEFAASTLEVKEHMIKKVYERCGNVAKAYVKSHPDEFQIGGPGDVLIVDEFPGGFMAEMNTDVTITKKRNNNCHTILCIAEAKSMPPRMWLHMIQALPEPSIKNDSDTPKQKCGMVEEALRVIVQHVRPGSYLVANNRARCCNYESLQEIKQYGVFSVENLQKFDSANNNNVLGNLATIWQTGVGICEDIQESTRPMGQEIIASYLWRQRFGCVPSTTFQNMLNHIAECYRFT